MIRVEVRSLSDVDGIETRESELHSSFRGSSLLLDVVQSIHDILQLQGSSLECRPRFYPVEYSSSYLR